MYELRPLSNISQTGTPCSSQMLHVLRRALMNCPLDLSLFDTLINVEVRDEWSVRKRPRVKWIIAG